MRIRTELGRPWPKIWKKGFLHLHHNHFAFIVSENNMLPRRLNLNPPRHETSSEYQREYIRGWMREYVKHISSEIYQWGINICNQAYRIQLIDKRARQSSLNGENLEKLALNLDPRSDARNARLFLDLSRSRHIRAVFRPLKLNILGETSLEIVISDSFFTTAHPPTCRLNETDV